MANEKIMVVEDDSILATQLGMRLNNLGYGSGGIASSGEEALTQAKETYPDLVLMDIRLKGDMDGIETAKQIQERFNIPVLFMSGYADEETLQRAKSTRPFGYIIKPFEDRELRAAIEIALYRNKMETRLEALNKLGQQISSSLSLDVVVQTAVSLIAENISADFAAVFLRHGEQLILKSYISSDPQFEKDRIPVHHVGECLCGLSVSRGEPVYASDMHTDPRCTFEECKNAHLSSFAAVPLRSATAVIGVLGIGSATPRDFAEDAPFLEALSSQVSTGLQNTILMHSVEKRREELQTFAGRLVEVEEGERRRIAQELHDRVGQNLGALNLSLGLLLTMLSAESKEKVGGRLNDCMKMVEDTAVLIRDVMADLRPSVLDDYGLIDALYWLAQQFSESTGVAAELDTEELPSRLAPNVETALFRIAQEALTNVAQHAQATRVKISTLKRGHIFQMSIADNGVGFDSKHTKISGRSSKWGVVNMRERALAVGGDMRVTSEAGKGTRVSVQVRS